MTVPVEEAVAALSTFSLEHEQPDIQGLAVTLVSGRSTTESPVDFEDTPAYQLSLVEDTNAIIQLDTLIREGKGLVAVLYTYRSCVKALPQLPETVKQTQADLYLETYQVLDIEIGRLREMQRWQSSAAFKLAVDMHNYTQSIKRLNGPTVTHMWAMLRLLDVLLQLDHLKNAKASIPNDFSWYKRTFTQVSANWPDTDVMREELDDLQIFLSTRWTILLNLQAEIFRVNGVEDIIHVLIIFCLECLESDRVLLFSERHTLLRVLPVLVVLATSGEKEGESIFKKIKIPRLMSIFKKDPVVPAFPDLHLAPASILKELAPYFHRLSAQMRLIGLPLPHELNGKEAAEYPPDNREYLIVNHMPNIRAQHDDYSIRFAAAMNQLELAKMTKNTEVAVSTQAKENMYLVIVEGFQLLSQWTGWVWEQSAWKFSRPVKEWSPFDTDHSKDVSDYEKVVRCNYTVAERKAMVELISYIKGIGNMMERVDTLVADSIWESVHAQVQDFVQNKITVMLRTSFKKKKELARILMDMRTVAADWMGNATSYTESDHALSKPKEENGKLPSMGFYSRAAGPTATQLHCLQYLILELVSGGAPKKVGSFFSATDTDIPSANLRQFENFFNQLAFFPHILDYRATLAHLTDVGFLWFREFYLETSRVIQFPIECSMPWMLVEHVLQSPDVGLLETVLMPFDIYNDAADYALRVLKQRFLYDEIEAEVDLCFDQLVFKLSEHIYSYYKSVAASKMLDMGFRTTVENWDQYTVFPKRYDHLFRVHRAKLLGRNINLAGLIAQRLNKMFRENLEFLFERFECHDLCAIVELQRLVEILELTHELLSKHVKIDPFNILMGEMTQSISLVSFSGRIATQVFLELQNDFFPNFILCTTTQRFVRSPKPCERRFSRPSIPYCDPSFLCGNQDLNRAHGSFTELHSKFFGLPHMLAVLKLVGPRSLPWLVRALLDYLSQKVVGLETGVEELRELMPKAITIPPHGQGVEGTLKHFMEQLQWATNFDGRQQMLQGLKEIGSVIFWMSLLDTAMRETETVHFMQVVPWLGVVPNKAGQLQQLLCDDNYSPLVSLFKEATHEILANPASTLNANSFLSMSKQAEVVDILYMNNLQTGSVLDYTLKYMVAVLAQARDSWEVPSKSGLIEITVSKEYHRIYSAIQFVSAPSNPVEGNGFLDRYGDAVAWGGCTILYLLGQQLRFELLDFTYHVLSVAEAEALPSAQLSLAEKSKSSYPSLEVAAFLDNSKKARRLNNHVFSLLRARSPHADKLASMIKQNGSVLHLFKYPIIPSILASLALRDAVEDNMSTDDADDVSGASKVPDPTPAKTA
ncbi:unnamed protein product [Sphagnum balticum]